MNATIMIEPCCCERQWPMVVNNNHGRAIVFTNGDVTVSHIFKSLSYMAGPTHTLTLMIRKPDVKLLRWMKTWMQRGWTKEVRMTCGMDARQLVAEELEGLTDRITLAEDATVSDEMICFEGERGVVVVCGRMLTEPQPGLTMYGCYHGMWRGLMAELISAVEARHKSHGISMEEGREKKEDGKGKRTKGRTKK